MSNTYTSIADKIKAAAKIKKSHIDGKKLNTFEESLPDGINLGMVQQLREVETNFIAGTAQAVGEMAVESGQDRVTGTFDMGGLEVTQLFERETVIGEKTYHNYISTEVKLPQGGEDAPISRVRKALAELVLNNNDEAQAEE